MALYDGTVDLAPSAFMRYGSPHGWTPPPAEVELPSIESLSVPRGLTLQPTWARQNDFDELSRDCVLALQGFPPQGEIKTLPYPLFETHGRCTMGLYFSDPKPNGNPEVNDQWANINTWIWATLKLYLSFSATGFSMDFDSGIQVTIFEWSLVNLEERRVGKKKWVMESLQYVIDDTLSGNRGRGRGRARGQNRGRTSSLLPSATTNSDTPVLSSLGTAIASVPFADFTGTIQVMNSWSGQTPLTTDDCKAAIFEISMVTWFFIKAGLFFDQPYVFHFERCALGMFLTTPPKNGPAPFLPGGEVNVEIMLFGLLMRTILDHSAPGYVDLPNGIQLAYWDWQYLDPEKKCWFITNISLQKCLDLMVMRKNKALGSALASSSILPATVPGITSAAVLPLPTGGETGAHTVPDGERLAQFLATLLVD
ncbi:hypothetical protein MMC17_004799 [Xylographa soralifera]|nr:hypothetical protein [Xylographa soralifera]